MTLGDVNKHGLVIHQRPTHFEKCWVVLRFENLMLGAKSKLVTLKPESWKQRDLLTLGIQTIHPAKSLSSVPVFISLNQSSFKSAFENLLLSLKVCLYPGQAFTVKPKQSAVGDGGTSIIYKFLELSGGDGEFPGARHAEITGWLSCQPSGSVNLHSLIKAKALSGSAGGTRAARYPLCSLAKGSSSERLATLSMLYWAESWYPPGKPHSPSSPGASIHSPDENNSLHFKKYFAMNILCRDLRS